MFCGEVSESTEEHLSPGHAEMEIARSTASGAGEPRSSLSPAETLFPDMRQEQRLARLEEEVRALRAELQDLKTRLGG